MDQEVREIDIVDLMFYCLKRWRMIIIFMCFFAVIVSGFQYQAEIKRNQEKQEQAAMITDEEEGKEPEELIDPVSSAVKGAVMGLILGGFFACLLFVMKYIAGGKLQDTKNLKKELGIPLLGIVRETKTKKRLFGVIDRWILRLEEGPFAEISSEEQMKIAAANAETAICRNLGDINKKIMVAGTMAEKEIRSEYLNLREKMTGIDLSSYKQLAVQSSAIKELSLYDGILFIEKKEKSPVSLIQMEKEMAEDRNVKVLGGIVFIS